MCSAVFMGVLGYMDGGPGCMLARTHLLKIPFISIVLHLVFFDYCFVYLHAEEAQQPNSSICNLFYAGNHVVFQGTSLYTNQVGGTSPSNQQTLIDCCSLPKSLPRKYRVILLLRGKHQMRFLSGSLKKEKQMYASGALVSLPCSPYRIREHVSFHVRGTHNRAIWTGSGLESRGMAEGSAGYQGASRLQQGCAASKALHDSQGSLVLKHRSTNSKCGC